MGFIAVIGLAISAATTIYQINQSKKAERARREGQAVQSASEEYKNQIARRTAAKERRLATSRLLQISQSTGTTGSSGEIGALSGIGTSFGFSTSNQRAEELTAKGLTSASAREANAISRSKRAGAWADLFQTGLGLYQTYSNGS